MKASIGKKVLVTSSSWFLAPDGKQYKGAFGVLKSINTSESTLGFTPNRTHTNWFLQVGNLSIAGCQVLQIIETETCNTEEVTDFTVDRTEQDLSRQNPVGKKAEFYTRGSYIYNAGE
jgi:hypothetical protein